MDAQAEMEEATKAAALTAVQLEQCERLCREASNPKPFYMRRLDQAEDAEREAQARVLKAQRALERAQARVRA